jgi:putative ABC transport system ATP-binding protein
MPNAVSGGQQQSAAIARALANDPPIIVADEPTGNLDSRSAEVIFEIFDELTLRGKTIIMVTHDDALAERASRLIRLVDGEVAEDVTLKAPISRVPEYYLEPTPVRLLTTAYALVNI